MDIARAHATYVANHAKFEEAADVLKRELVELCLSAGVTCHVEARAKTIASFVKKSVGTKAYTDPWQEVTDKVGARIVVDSIAALEVVLDAIESPRASDLAPHSVVDKSDVSDPDSLHYPGIHMQVTVGGVTLTTGETVEAEVQLRTKAQDLWATTSHKFSYKGVVPLSKQNQRRIWRLSVLSALFDEEVDRVMTDLVADANYVYARYLQIAEAQYLRLVPQPGNDALSLAVLEAIAPAIEDVPETYEPVLRAFTDANLERLRHIYVELGPSSPWEGEFNYWMFGQPESVVAFQLIEARPSALADLVVGTELDGPFRELFSAWGKPLAD